MGLLYEQLDKLIELVHRVPNQERSHQLRGRAVPGTDWSPYRRLCSWFGIWGKKGGSGTPKVEMPHGSELTEDQLKRLEAARVNSGAEYKLTKARKAKDGGAVLELVSEGTMQARSARSMTLRYVIALTQSAFRDLKDLKSLRVTWSAKWRNRFGQVEIRPLYTSFLTRQDFDRIVWENLTHDEQLRLIEIEEHGHTGWTLWEGK